MLEIEGKKIAVIGLSRTGIAAAKALSAWGAAVIVSDKKKYEELKNEIEMLGDIEVEYELGVHGEKSLNSDLIVVSPGVPLTLPFFDEARKKGIPIIGEIELAYHFTEAKIIAITGTNGKTTTTSLIGEILSRADTGRVKVAGNIGIPLISEVPDLTRNDWLVVEISSFQLETIHEFRPDISLYLNFTPDHLDRHKTIENYWLAKKRIFMNQGEDDYAVVNYDDQEVMKAVAGFPGNIYCVSTKCSPDKGIFLKDNQLLLKDKNDPVKLLDINEIKLKGMHNVQNVAFAAMASYLAGVPQKVIREAVLDFEPGHHRLEEVCFLDTDILVIDDSKATNPDSAIKGIEAVERPIVLIAGGQDRNADFSEWAEIVKKRVKTLILIGETSGKMKEEALKHGFSNINIHIAGTMEKAVSIALENLKTGDCLLLSPGCPSWDMYSSYVERGEEYQKLVKSISKKRG
jgi:UDP-N-acetylmuramoylalanine--D-glutamate ligase